MISADDIVNDVGRELRPLNTTDEVASVLRISRRHTYRLLASGELTAIQGRPGGPLRIPRAVVLDYIERLAEG